MPVAINCERVDTLQDIRPNTIGWTQTVKDETVCDLAMFSKSMLSLSMAGAETEKVFSGVDDWLKRKFMKSLYRETPRM